MAYRREFLALVGGTGFAGCTSVRTERNTDSSDRHFVSSDSGSDTNPGTSASPLATIQEALDRADPGDTVRVEPGEYREVLTVPQGGSPGSPVTLTGPPDAVVRPPRDVEQGRPILEVMRSHFHVTGLTFNGLAKAESPSNRNSYSGGVELKADPQRHDYMTDLKFLPYRLGNFEGAMIATERIMNAEIGGFRVIGPAGVQYLHTEDTGAFAEIVYLGSGIDVDADDYAWDTIDETRNVHVHHIDNRGGHPHSELVDTKPGTRNITIEYCSDYGGAGQYIESAGIGVKGREIVVRWNELRNGGGDGIQIGAWNVTHPEEAPATIPETVIDSGRANSVYGNRMSSFRGLALKFQPNNDETDPGFMEGYGPDAQKTICGNEYTGQTHGNPDRECSAAVPDGDGIGHAGGAFRR